MGSKSNPEVPALAWDETLLRSLLESAPDAMLVVDEDGRILLVNRQVEQLFGYPRGELLGQKIEKLIPKRLRKEHGAHRERYFEQPRSRPMGESQPLFGRRQDGSEFPVEISLSPIAANGGMLVSSIVRDASGHHHVRETLEETEARYRNLIESTHDLVQSVAPDGRLLFVNRAWLETLGYEDGDLADLNLFDVIHHDSESDCKEMFERILEGESVEDIEATLVGKDGRLVAVEGNASPRIVDGKVIATQGFFHDVTRRRKAEQAVRTRVRQQEAVSQFGSFVLSERDLGLVLQRAVELIGETLEIELCEVLELRDGGWDFRLRAGRGWKRGKVGRATVPAGLDSQAGFTISSNAPVITENILNEERFRCPALLLDHAAVSGMTVVIGGRKASFGVLGAHSKVLRKFTLDDVNFLQAVANILAHAVERDRQESELEHTREEARQKGRLADIGAISSKIAHDLGNPLAGLMLQAQLVVRCADRGAPLGEILEPARMVVETARHLDGMMREFRSFAREQTLSLSELDLAGFLQVAVENWGPVAASQNIDVALHVDDDVPPLTADEGKLRRVLDNLVKNALEAIEEGPGEISLSARVGDPGRIILEVTDTGPGIPKGLEVFRLFKTTKPDGTGLGLPICRQLVRAHGGEMEFTSRKPHGTVFRLDLPVTGP